MRRLTRFKTWLFSRLFANQRTTLLGLAVAVIALVLLTLERLSGLEALELLVFAAGLLASKDSWFTRRGPGAGGIGGAALLIVVLGLLVLQSCVSTRRQRKQEEARQTTEQLVQQETTVRRDCVTVRPLALTVAGETLQAGLVDSLRSALLALQARGLKPVIVYRSESGKLDQTFYLDSLGRMQARCTMQEQSLALQLTHALEARDSALRLAKSTHSTAMVRREDLLRVEAGRLPWWGWLLVLAIIGGAIYYALTLAKAAFGRGSRLP